MYQNILINALGIQDSGGIRVLEKMLYECTQNKKYIYYVFVNGHQNITHLIEKFIAVKNIVFKEIENKGILHRLYTENISFRSFINKHNIVLVYNFSGSNQYLQTTPTLVKVQNLMFYSKRLDDAYKKYDHKKLWIKQVWMKRLIFLSMLKKSQNLEIQSTHVKDALSDFMNVENKKFFLKNDFSASENDFSKSKKYDFDKKITFLYIVGPHFDLPHKNIQDFVKAMRILKDSRKEFEIKITLSFDELNNSSLWDTTLNDNTTFLGYLKDKNEIQKLFQNNTILISTSVIETLGLHIIEGIQDGVLCIAPDELYAKSVYGDDLLKYLLFASESLVYSIFNIYDLKEREIQNMFSQTQQYIINNEENKYHNIVDIFDEILEKE